MSVSALLARIKHFVDGRKRKSSDEPSEASTTFAKYRRVVGDIPQFVSTPLSNNDLHSKPDIPSISLKHHSPSPQYRRKPVTMAESSTNSKASSYFGGVTGMARLEYADIEFSDDEDDVEWINRQMNHRPTTINAAAASKTGSAALRCPPPLAKLKQKPAPVPSLFPINRSQQMVNGNSGGGHNRPDTFKKPFVFKSQQQQQQQQQAKRNSIIAQSYNQEEVNNYRALLKRLLPNIYSPEEPAHSTMGAGLGSSTRKSSLLPPPLDEFNLSSSTALNASGGRHSSSSAAMTRSIPVIDLSLEESDAEGRKNRTSLYTTVDPAQYDLTHEEETPEPQVIAPVNTLREKLETNSKFSDDIVSNVQRKYDHNFSHRKSLIEQERENLKELQKNTQEYEVPFQRKMGDFMLKFDGIVLDEEEPEEEEEYPELTEEHTNIIKRALYGGSRTEVVISKFNISVTRNDLATLVGDSWLNDEVINFYMNLLIERSEQRADEGLPRVYAMNTFFIPKLLTAGHSGLKRWTRKVDIFTYDIIPVPVHVGRVHWCMAIIDLKNQAIRYYDSMGTPNNPVLNALEQYLRDESLDKRKQPFDTSRFKKMNMHECPRQMNGSDCGVFSCMFAEHEARGREIGFTQQQMPYFREKMIYEIATGRLLT